MDHTYAEIEETYAQNFSLKTPPNSQQPSRRSRNPRRDELDSPRLPIEFRYPKRNSMTSSSAKKKQSFVSKSSSSGYSSASSVSSVTTVVNGARPYRPQPELMVTMNTTNVSETKKPEVKGNTQNADMSMVNRMVEEDSEEENAGPEEESSKMRACCIECREKEIRQELDLESHQYANLASIKKPLDPYVFLMTSMLSNLRKEADGRKVARVQQKIEKVLRLRPREPFNVDHKPTFDLQVSTFGSDVMLRLRAVSEVAPDTYREISAKFCEALHCGAPNGKGLKGIVKTMKNLLNL